MKCFDVMKKDVVTVGPDDRVLDAARKMADRDVGFLPVVEGNKPIGVITDRDIVVRVVAEQNDGLMLVKDAMSHDLFSARGDDELDKAARTMADKKVSRLLVLGDDGALQGVISLSDLPRHDDVRAREVLAEVAGRESAP